MMNSILATVLIFGLQVSATAKETVVLIHGLTRSSGSMSKLQKSLEKAGYDVVNLDYPSREYSIEDLSAIVRDEIVLQTAEANRVHVVTHSMGGVIIRYIQERSPMANIGRVVMLSPPNHGSELVDVFGRSRLFKWINGPAGLQLGTDGDSLTAQLKPVEFELGVIAGDRSFDWIFSCMIPGKDDGRVSIESAQVEGMRDFKIVHATHPFIVKKRRVIAEVIEFLKSGRFSDA